MSWNMQSEAGPLTIIGSMIRRGLEPQAVRLAILKGERDENRLTNQAFFSRYPERQGRGIGRNEPDLASEWRDILAKLVRPALALPDVQSTQGPQAQQAPAIQVSGMPSYIGIDEASVDENKSPGWALARDKAGVKFAIIRAYTGYSADPVFQRDWPKIREAGLVRGAYLFLSFPHP